MKKQIIQAIKRLWEWIKLWMWTKPTSKPVKTLPLRTMATDVVKDYVIVMYHGQKINLHQTEVPMWNMSSRKDKRITSDKFASLEKKGLIRFESINGKEVCIRNMDYGRRAEKVKENK